MQSEAVIERSHFDFFVFSFLYAFDEGVQNLPYCQTYSGDSDCKNKMNWKTHGTHLRLFNTEIKIEWAHFSWLK